MSKSRIQIIIHPFVYFKVLNNSYLFINTINKIYIKGKSKSVISFLKDKCYQLPKYDTIYYYKNNEVLEDEVNLFLERLLENNMAVILNSKSDKKSPIAVTSDIVIKLEEMLKYSDAFRKDNLLKLNVFINTYNDKKGAQYYRTAYKQFLFPYVDLKQNYELNAQDIFNFAKKALFSNLINLNFVFGDLSCALNYHQHFKHFENFNISICSVLDDAIKNLENLEKLHTLIPALKFNWGICI